MKYADVIRTVVVESRRDPRGGQGVRYEIAYEPDTAQTYYSRLEDGQREHWRRGIHPVITVRGPIGFWQLWLETARAIRRREGDRAGAQVLTICARDAEGGE